MLMQKVAKELLGLMGTPEVAARMAAGAPRALEALAAAAASAVASGGGGCGGGNNVDALAEPALVGKLLLAREAALLDSLAAVMKGVGSKVREGRRRSSRR